MYTRLVQSCSGGRNGEFGEPSCDSYSLVLLLAYFSDSRLCLLRPNSYSNRLPAADSVLACRLQRGVLLNSTPHLHIVGRFTMSATPILLASIALLAGVAARPVNPERADDLAEYVSTFQLFSI